jgi:hypothetical protein
VGREVKGRDSLLVRQQSSMLIFLLDRRTVEVFVCCLHRPLQERSSSAALRHDVARFDDAVQ